MGNPISFTVLDEVVEAVGADLWRDAVEVVQVEARPSAVGPREIGIPAPTGIQDEMKAGVAENLERRCDALGTQFQFDGTPRFVSGN